MWNAVGCRLAARDWFMGNVVHMRRTKIEEAALARKGEIVLVGSSQVGAGFDVGRLDFIVLAVLVGFEGLRDRRGVGGVDLDSGRLEHGEGLGAAVAADERLDAGAGDALGGLDAGALRGVEVLRVVDELERGGLGVVDEELRCAPEAGVEGRGEIRARCGECNFHVGFWVMGIGSANGREFTRIGLVWCSFVSIRGSVL